MKMPNYHLYLTDDEYSQVIHCLVELKNKMMEFNFKIQQYQTDAVDAVAQVFNGQRKYDRVSYIPDCLL